MTEKVTYKEKTSQETAMEMSLWQAIKIRIVTTKVVYHHINWFDFFMYLTFFVILAKYFNFL